MLLPPDRSFYIAKPRFTVFSIAQNTIRCKLFRNAVPYFGTQARDGKMRRNFTGSRLINPRRADIIVKIKVESIAYFTEDQHGF